MDQIVIPKGGEAAGKLEFHRVSCEEALEYARTKFAINHQPPVHKELPRFKTGFELVKGCLPHRGRMRNEMPVIDEGDIKALREALTRIDITDLCEVCVWPAHRLFPIQKTIYVDKSVDSMARFGVKSTSQFLTSTHLIVSSDGAILDGNHRWSSGCLIDFDFPFTLFKVGMGLEPFLKFLLAFSDAKGRVRNA